MSEYISVFRNKSGELLINESYDSLMNFWSVPFDDLYIDTRLGMTHIIASGPVNAPPIFLIHAFYASAVSWYRNVRCLAENYRVYAVDIIGDPNKSKPLRPIRQLSDYVSWFRDLMNTLNTDTADFIGNSVGAYHIANFALNEPERVRSITLIGPAATYINIPGFYINTFPGGMTGWNFFVDHAVNWIENGAPLDPEFHRLFYLLLRYGKSANQVFPAVLTDEQLKQIRTPTLLIYGEKEVIYNYNLAINRAIRLMQNIKTEVIPGANHLTGASRPDKTNEIILDFLSSLKTEATSAIKNM